MMDKEQKNEEKKWGLYNTFENPEEFDKLSEIDVWKKIESLGGALYWAEHDAGKLWASKLSNDTLINARYNLEYLVYLTKKFGVKFDKEPNATDHVQRSESYNAWFSFWDKHFKSMSNKELGNFVADKISGKDISKYMPKDTWQDYYKKSVLDKTFSKYNFKNLNEFTWKLHSEIDEVVNTQFSKEWTMIDAKLKNGLNLNIIVNNKEDMDWITFYIKNDSINLEQVEFMLLKNNEYDFDKIIKHHYFTVDNEIATTFNSSYIFVDGDYDRGIEQHRKVNFKDIKSYAGIDNLANFAAVIDNSKNEIIYKEDNRDLGNPQINLFYLKK